jgi:hypothetical protein
VGRLLLGVPGAIQLLGFQRLAQLFEAFLHPPEQAALLDEDSIEFIALLFGMGERGFEARQALFELFGVQISSSRSAKKSW